MCAAVAADKVGKPGSIGDDLLAFLCLAVKNTKRIRSETPFAVVAETLFLSAQKFQDDFSESGTAGGASQRIEFKAHILQTDGGKKMHEHEDNFRIRLRVIEAQQFRIDLMKLPETAPLGSFPAKHGTDGEQPADRFGIVERMFQISPDHRSRRFRPKRQILVSPVEKSVHFLFDNIGGFTNPSFEKIRLFQNGKTDFLESEAGKNFPCGVFHKTPFSRFLGKNVLETLNGRNDFHFD
jgi:hypothetical protein